MTQEQGKYTDFLSYAIKYAKRGFWVFPCEPKEKKPLIKDWPNQATTDVNKIKAWWQRWPNANIGILCGKEFADGKKLVVLDIDPRNGGDWEGLGLPDTLICETGTRGRHYYFFVPTDVKIPKKNLGPGLDLQGERSYVIAPPSIHPNDQTYDWLDLVDVDEVEIAPLPDLILDLLSEPEKANSWRHYINTQIPKGLRNIILTSYAGHLRSQKGLDEEALYTELQKWNEEKCTPPLPDKEVRQIARSIAKYPVPEKAQPPLGRKSKEKKVIDVLKNSRWVRYQERMYIQYKNALFTPSSAYKYLSLHDVYISQSKAKELASAIASQKLWLAEYENLSNCVVQLDSAPVYGISSSGLEGIWFRYKGKPWCFTTNGEYRQVDDESVYYVEPAEDAIDVSLHHFPKGEEGEKQEYLALMYYTTLAFSNVVSPADPRVALAAVAPVLLGLGNAGILLEGPGGSGKSTSGNLLYYLAYQMLPPTAMGDTMRDYIIAVSSERIMYKDDIKALFTKEETLVRVSLTGGAAKIRGLFTDYAKRFETGGSAIVCGYDVKFNDPTTIERFIRIEYKAKERETWENLRREMAEMAPQALAGLFRLFAEAAKEPAPSEDMLEIRLRDWFVWAIRFARVLKVENEFRRWLVEMSASLFKRLGDWAELFFMLREGEIGEGKYLLSDLARKIIERKGVDNEGEMAQQLGGLVEMALEGGGQNLATICERAGYSISFIQQREQKSRKKRWFVELKRNKLGGGKKERWAKAGALLASWKSDPIPQEATLNNTSEAKSNTDVCDPIPTQDQQYTNNYEENNPVYDDEYNEPENIHAEQDYEYDYEYEYNEPENIHSEQILDNDETNNIHEQNIEEHNETNIMNEHEKLNPVNEQHSNGQDEMAITHKDEFLLYKFLEYIRNSQKPPETMIDLTKFHDYYKIWAKEIDRTPSSAEYKTLLSEKVFWYHVEDRIGINSNIGSIKLSEIKECINNNYVKVLPF